MIKNKTIFLDSCLQIVEEKINPQTSIIQGITFHLDQKNLIKILNAKDQDLSLKISENLLNRIRYYCLIDQYQSYNLQSNLNFITYFEQINHHKPILKTSIGLEGNITNQICDRCLENSDLILSLITAHSWLIEEILQEIKFQFKPIKIKKIIQKIAWIIAFVMIVISIIFNLQHFQNNILLWIAPIMVFFLLQWAIQKLLWLNLGIIRRWLLKQMFYGWFSHQQKQQNQTLNILNDLGL